MKYCNNCKISIKGEYENCPLCQDELVGENTQQEYPSKVEADKETSMIVRWVVFIALVASLVGAFLDMVINERHFWSVAIILVFIGVASSIIIGVKKHKSILKCILYQSLIIGAFAIIMDNYFGYKGWSITFVIPIIFTISTISMYTLAKVLKMQVADYMIYVMIGALFGVITVGLLRVNGRKADWPIYICILVNSICLIAIGTFEGKNLINELMRRLHV